MHLRFILPEREREREREGKEIEIHARDKDKPSLGMKWVVFEKSLSKFNTWQVTNMKNRGRYQVFLSAYNSLLLTFFNPADPREIAKGGLPGFPSQLNIFPRSGAKG